jgi:hypothetical protein
MENLPNQSLNFIYIVIILYFIGIRNGEFLTGNIIGKRTIIDFAQRYAKCTI